MTPVAMREECKHFESRTYGNGEAVRKCNLDLAPEAPWRCPADCPKYAPRMADVNWTHGTLIIPPAPDAPPGLDDGAAQLLDEAEDVLNSVGPQILAEVEAQRAAAGSRMGLRSPSSWWQRLRRRR